MAMPTPPEVLEKAEDGEVTQVSPEGHLAALHNSVNWIYDLLNRPDNFAIRQQEKANELFRDTITDFNEKIKQMMVFLEGMQTCLDAEGGWVVDANEQAEDWKGGTKEDTDTFFPV